MSGVPLNPVPEDWATVGVPTLVLALRVHLRSFFESILTQHLSKLVVSSPSQGKDVTSTLESCVRALPKYHRDTLRVIFAALAEVARDDQWLDSCSIALGCVVVNAKTTDASIAHSLERVVSVFIRHWDHFHQIVNST